jgi:type II secretory pathway pseudopilin PulG
MKAPMVLLRNARSDSGFALIEAVVSAAVLAVIALAVLSGIDAASGSSAREKARAVAASLAEADQERLRAMPVEMLSTLGTAAPVIVDGVSYTVDSRAEWVTDDTGGTPSCGNASNNNQYLHITSTGTSSVVGVRITPVKIDSLVAPSVVYSSTHGTLGVKVVDRNAAGVQNVSVTVINSSPAYTPPTAFTDAAGCVLFRNAPIGTYTIKLNRSGYVDPDGNLESVGTQKVSPGVVTFKTMEYDRATTANVTVKTSVPGSPAVLQDSKAQLVSISNAKRTGLLRTFTNAAPPAALSVTPLYPFKDTAYAFFTGKCAYESPDKLGNTNYFGDNPTSGVLADPAVSQPQNATVQQPPFNLRIERDYANSATYAAGNVVVYATLVKPAASSTDPCTELTRVQMALKAWPGGTWGSAPGSKTTNWVVQNDGVAGQFDPGMPFGNYTICVWDKAPNPDRYTSFNYDNSLPGGSTSTAGVGASAWITQSC